MTHDHCCHIAIASVLVYARRSGWGFAMTAVGAVGMVATIFTGLYPRVLVSHPTFANSLTVATAASGHYELKVITIVAVMFAPLVVLYQSWTYYVFRKRIGGEEPVEPTCPITVRPPPAFPKRRAPARRSEPHQLNGADQ
jgi:cytochrome d ubiquinol oxidase subunit II